MSSRSGPVWDWTLGPCSCWAAAKGLCPAFPKLKAMTVAKYPALQMGPPVHERELRIWPSRLARYELARIVGKRILAVKVCLKTPQILDAPS